jgi:membrane associated rhomboid family serine protease
MFAKFGSHGVGVLTYLLIVGCVLVAIYSNVGKNIEVLRRLFITDPMSPGFLSEVYGGEFWRLITPIFIHFGYAHLIFNMLWLFDLGCMIEARQGTLTLAALVAVSGVLSNMGQYALAHTVTFGGMSGVVYALAGYVWIRGKYDRASGVGLHSQSVTILLVWLVVCYTNALGPVANTAHLVGLIVGMLWGRISAYFALRKPE